MPNLVFHRKSKSVLESIKCTESKSEKGHFFYFTILPFTHNCEFTRHSSNFITHSWEFISLNSGKIVRIAGYKSITTFLLFYSLTETSFQRKDMRVRKMMTEDAYVGELVLKLRGRK